MQQAATLGVIRSEATPEVPARVATCILPPSATREPHQIPIFAIFMRMGLVPPFSDIFLVILEAYGLKLLHLTPSAILDLTIFAYTCEAFVGVVPFVALFRHFFYPRACKEGWMGGGVTFYFRPRIKAAGYPKIVIKSKWEEWRAGWFLVEVPALSPLFQEPTELVMNEPSWTRLSMQDNDLDAGVNRLKLLHD